MTDTHEINKLNVLKALPEALRNDKKMAAIADLIAELLICRLEDIKLLNIYSQIDELPEELLDILAYDFKVDWWDSNYTVEEKRSTLKSCWRVHRILGTKSAVETAVSAIFPDSKVYEWFEYGGRPGCFRICSKSPAITSRSIILLLDMIRKVKRASSQLESFEFELESLGNVYFGLAFQISGELDIWPRAARSIISEGEASALSSVNIKASIETYPYGITHHVSTVGEANIVSALSYNAGIEVFPLENQ